MLFLLKRQTLKRQTCFFIDMPNLETPHSFPLHGTHACYPWNGSVKYPISETGSPPALRWLVSPAV